MFPYEKEPLPTKQRVLFHFSASLSARLYIHTDAMKEGTSASPEHVLEWTGSRTALAPTKAPAVRLAGNGSLRVPSFSQLGGDSDK